MLKPLLVLLSLVIAASAGIKIYNAGPPPEIPPMKETLIHTQYEGSERPRYSKLGHDLSPLSQERIEELAQDLTAEEARILLRKGTEMAFCGNLLDNKKEGVYICRLCSLPLFSSDAKFDSGTGWPSYSRPVDEDHIRYEKDQSHGMVRTEIMCARCGGHLGHVFDDGPRPTGRRYCLNSASLRFFEKGEELPAAAQPVEVQAAYFAGGCFWGVEHRFEQLPGVIDAISGYQGGTVDNPTYEQVCAGNTRHAETVKVIFDPARITYRKLLEEFFKLHDPTQVNRQGPDVGTQYRSAIFAADERQLEEAKKFIAEMSDDDRFAGRRIATEIVPIEKAGKFWEAEDYHQDYHARRGTSCSLP